jgi:GAF domain-containing protein
MNIAPDLDKILDLMGILDQGVQAGSSMDSLLGEALSAIVEALPSTRAAHVYRLNAAQDVLRSMTDETVFFSITPEDIYSRALKSQSPIWDKDRAKWAASLYASNEPLGVLEIEIDSAETPQLDMNRWLRLLADRISVTIHTAKVLQDSRVAREIADNLVVSSRLVMSAKHYSDMAQAAVYTIAQNMAGVAITLFNQPLDAISQPQTRAVMALGLAEGPMDIENVQYTVDLPDQAQLKSLWRGQPVIVQDFKSSGFELAARVYQQYSQANVTWLAAFGLRAADQVLGTLEVLHTQDYQLLPEEMDAYTTLADQIGVSVRNQQLLQQTTESLEETKTLYDVNNAMIGAQDMLDVLRALRILAPDSSNISDVIFEYDDHRQIIEMAIQYIITANDEQVVYTPLLGSRPEEVRTIMRRYWQQMKVDLVVVEDISRPPSNVLPLMFSATKNQDVGSSVMIPIYERGSLRDLITIAFDHPIEFDSKMRRLYTAVRDQISIVLQSQHLLQESQVSAAQLSNQVRILETLNRVALMIGTSHDEKQLLDETAQALVDVTGADYCRVLMLDASGKTAIIESEYPDDGSVGSRFDIARLLFYDQMYSGHSEPIVVTAIDTDTRLSEDTRQQLRSGGVHSTLILPLVVQGRFIGSIDLDMRKINREWTPAVVDTARTITAEVVVGLQNIRLLNEAQRQAARLQRASTFGQSLQSTLDLTAILETALTEGGQILPVDRMSVALVGDEDGVLRTIAMYANGENYLTLSNGAPVLNPGSIIARTWEREEFLYIPDTAQNGENVEIPEVRSLMIMPMILGTQSLGIVTVGCERPYAYSETDAAVFRQMAGQLAAAVENAAAFARSQRIAKNEGLVNDISVQLQQQLDIQGMLSVAANELGRALGARRARIRLGTHETDKN